MALQLVTQLLQALSEEGIHYCQWKSNLYLQEALEGEGDLDLLVSSEEAKQFEHALASLGFKRVVEPLQPSPTKVLHFYDLDRMTGRLLHLHVYYCVVTGESLVKNYCLPLEAMLLEHARIEQGMPVPRKPAELMICVIRAMAKHTSLIEYLLLLRKDGSGYKALRQELAELIRDDSLSDSVALLRHHLPSVDPQLFTACVAALLNDSPLAQRVWLAVRLRRQLKAYERFAPSTSVRLKTKLILHHAFGKLRVPAPSKRLVSGGKVIAFIGPEATGKSTLVESTAKWLRSAVDVSTVHLGKPPSSRLTFLPNLAVPLLRRLAPQARTSHAASDSHAPRGGSTSLLYAIRSIIDAWDRRALAMDVRRRAASGGVVICDRYPSSIVGAMDSPRLDDTSSDGLLGEGLAHLAELERRVYSQIPAPDIVIQLTVPVDVAVQRNRQRQKKGKENDSYVVRRHVFSAVPAFPAAKTSRVDSNEPVNQTISSIRRSLWDIL